MNDDVAALLAAIKEALDVPLPAVGEENDREYVRLLERRTAAIRTVLEAIPGGDDVSDYDVRAIRLRTEHSPITYEPFVSSSPA